MSEFTRRAEPSGSDESDSSDHGFTRRAAPAQKPRQQVQGIWEHEKQNVQESLDQMRKPGIFNKAMGGLGYATAGASALSQGILGDPARYAFKGAPQGVRDFAGRTAEAVGDIFGPGGAAKAAREAPGMLREAPGAARAIGGVLRGGVDAVDDIVKAGLARRQTRIAERAANAPPTKEKRYSDATAGFEEAAKAGGELPEGYLERRIAGDGTPENMGLRDKLAASDINLADHPELYKQAKDMMNVIDRKVEDGSIKSFADLMKLHREMRPYVRRAKAEGVREGDDTGLRAATILRNEVGKMLEDFPDASGKLAKAKADYKIASKMDDIDEIINASTRMNDPKMLQKEFKDIALDKYAYNNYTPAEQKLIDQIAGNSRLENVASELSHGKVRSVASAALGATNLRMKLAKQLREMVARGEEAQNAPRGPSAFERINKVLRPGPPNSANRQFPYPDQ